MRRHWLFPALSLALLLAPAAAAEPEKAVEGPRWRSEEFDAGVEAVREALDTAFENAGLTLDAAAEGEVDGERATGFLEFTEDDFGPDVATTAPKYSRTYPFLQTRRMGQGEYRVRVQIEPSEGGTRVDLLVEMLAPAFNRITYEHTKLDRDSNGVIERYFHTRIELALLQATEAATD